jgi:hypothetical protein
MLMLGFKLMILGFRFTLPPYYAIGEAIGYYFELIMKIKYLSCILKYTLRYFWRIINDFVHRFILDRTFVDFTV